jgi:hypothetical protein
MTDIDPLGVDALLVLYGAILGLVVGVGLLGNDPGPIRPTVVVGLALPFPLAFVIGRAADRIEGADVWLTETRRGRIVIALAFALLLGFRVALNAAPSSIQAHLVWGMFGTGGGMIALGLGRATHRAVSGRTEREASEG